MAWNIGWVVGIEQIGNIGTTKSEAGFVDEAGQAFYFRVLATDHVNNASAPSLCVAKYYYHGTQRACPACPVPGRCTCPPWLAPAGRGGAGTGERSQTVAMRQDDVVYPGLPGGSQDRLHS
jgi:hypothetical protein